MNYFCHCYRKAFPGLINDDDKFYMDDKTLRYGLGELSGLSLQSASAHVMGEAFQALMGPSFTRR